MITSDGGAAGVSSGAKDAPGDRDGQQPTPADTVDRSQANSRSRALARDGLPGPGGLPAREQAAGVPGGRVGQRVKVSGLPLLAWVGVAPRLIWVAVAGLPPMFKVRVIEVTFAVVVKRNPVTFP
jgi:hypothetical protein